MALPHRRPLPPLARAQLTPPPRLRSTPRCTSSARATSALATARSSPLSTPTCCRARAGAAGCLPRLQTMRGSCRSRSSPSSTSDSVGSCRSSLLPRLLAVRLYNPRACPAPRPPRSSCDSLLPPYQNLPTPIHTSLLPCPHHCSDPRSDPPTRQPAPPRPLAPCAPSIHGDVHTPHKQTRDESEN